MAVVLKISCKSIHHCCFATRAPLVPIKVAEEQEVAQPCCTRVDAVMIGFSLRIRNFFLIARMFPKDSCLVSRHIWCIVLALTRSGERFYPLLSFPPQYLTEYLYNRVVVVSFLCLDRR